MREGKRSKREEGKIKNETGKGKLARNVAGSNIELYKVASSHRFRTVEHGTSQTGRRTKIGK